MQRTPGELLQAANSCELDGLQVSETPCFRSGVRQVRCWGDRDKVEGMNASNRISCSTRVVCFTSAMVPRDKQGTNIGNGRNRVGERAR